MENIYHPAAIWFILGIFFLLLEFATPGFIIFFLGIASWITGIICYITSISINSQLLIFIVASLGTIVLFRKNLKNFQWSPKSTEAELEEEYIGKMATALTTIKPGQPGKVEFKGTSWEAHSSDVINPGEMVKIINTESIVLIVSSIKS